MKSAASVGLAVLIAVMPGLAAGRLVADEGFDAGTLLRYELASVLAVGFAYAFAVRRAQDRVAALRRMNTRLLPLAAAPALVLVLDPNLTAKRGGLVFAAIGVAAALTGIAASSVRPRRARGRWDLYGVGLATIAVGVHLARLAWIRNATMQTNTFDLGLFTNTIWNTGNGDLFRCTFLASGTLTSEHFSPILILFAPFDPPANALLIVQAFAIVSGAVPAYLLGRRHLGNAGGRVLALAYLLHPAVHANALWDFHPLSFAPPVILWLAWIGPRRRTVAFAVLAAVLLALREELAVFAVMFALYLALRGGKRRGAALAGAAILYIGILVAAGLLGEAHVHRYSALAEHGGGGRGGLFSALFLDPAFVLQHALSYQKVGYVLMQCMPVLLVVLWVREGWVLLALGLAMVLLASSGAVINPYFHYSSAMYPAAFVAAGRGATAVTVRLSRAFTRPRADVRRGVVAAMFTAAVGTSLAYGGLHDNETFRAGFTAPRRELTDAAVKRLAALERTLGTLPADASLAVTGRVGPHVAKRSEVYQYPEVPDADYLIVFRSDLREKHMRELRAAVGRGELEIVHDEFSIVVYRTLPPG